VAPSGAFAVAWEAGGGEIDARYFNADGSAEGASFVIDPGPAQANETFSSPKAALDASGHLVAVWIDDTSGGTTSTIVGRTVSGP
jgi:hypothetical protein